MRESGARATEWPATVIRINATTCMTCHYRAEHPSPGVVRKIPRSGGAHSGGRGVARMAQGSSERAAGRTVSPEPVAAPEELTRAQWAAQWSAEQRSAALLTAEYIAPGQPVVYITDFGGEDGAAPGSGAGHEALIETLDMLGMWSPRRYEATGSTWVDYSADGTMNRKNKGGRPKKGSKTEDEDEY